uniref:Secreted protein n=1 Tax=Caenorhabditis japonica TaxID=281687 RepID=A0A8R1EFR4_CAEJA
MKWGKQIVLVHLAHLMNALSVQLVWKQSSAPTCPKRNSEGVKDGKLVSIGGGDPSSKPNTSWIITTEHLPHEVSSPVKTK